ncbi:zf-CCHC 3 domain containing protein [Trichuris trichiura]|uniref:Zf-CCHC 3 domain containing protein n=1 Tax=Trichuris trichiura TaxID=36087 RepID=A0A077ZGX8_TRITR|nr:zf-CCHC 3 domain containing protein [Trichuris trichiura]
MPAIVFCSSGKKRGLTSSATTQYSDEEGGEQHMSVQGACKKCGYVGHLPFQCRNLVALKNQKDVVLDVSSTSSESSPSCSFASSSSKSKRHRYGKEKKKKENKELKKHKKHSRKRSS